MGKTHGRHGYSFRKKLGTVASQRLYFCYFFFSLSRWVQTLPRPIKFSKYHTSFHPLASVSLKFTQEVVQLCVADIAWKPFSEDVNRLSTLFKVLFRKSSLFRFGGVLYQKLHTSRDACPVYIFTWHWLKQRKHSLRVCVCVCVCVCMCDGTANTHTCS